MKKNLFRICSFFNNDFVKNSLLFSAFSFLNSGLNFLLLLMLANYLTAEDYGQLNMYNILLTFLGFVIPLNCNSYISVVYYRNTKEKVVKYISIIFKISIVLLTILLLATILIPNIDRCMGISKKMIVLTALIAFTQVFTNILLDLWRLEEKILSYGVFTFILVIVNIVLSLLLIIKLDLGWEGRVYAQLITVSCMLCVALIILKRKSYLSIIKNSKTEVRDILNYGIPLIPHSISSWIRMGIDRYMINMFYPMAVVGIYSFAFNIANIIQVIGFAFNATYSVFLYKVLSNNKNDDLCSLRKITNIMILVFSILTVFVVLIGNVVIQNYFLDYANATSYLGPLCISTLFQCLYYLYVNYLFYFSKTRQLMLITLSTTTLHFILVLVFVRYSEIYAVYINMLTSILIFVLVYMYSGKIIKNKKLFL